MRLKNKLLLIVGFQLLLVSCGPEAGFEVADRLPENLETAKVNEVQAVDSLQAKTRLARTVVTPTKKLSENEFPQFEDDLNFDLIDLAISRQLKRFNERNMNHSIKLGDELYSYSAFKETLVEFQEIVNKAKNCRESWFTSQRSCLRKMNDEIKEKFNVYSPVPKQGDKGYGKEKSTHFTAYYTPTLKAKLQRDAEYQWGIYSRPSSDSLRRKTREQIDFDDALIGTGNEMFFTKDLFENYLLHVEGGGRVEIEENGEKKYFYLSYDKTNSRHFQFISKHMFEKGYIDNYSIAAQKKFLEARPDLYREIYSTCPSYVYFKVTETPPLGSDNVPLTDNRSIALDYRIYSLKGMLAFVNTKRLKPDSETRYRDFSRFMIDQDTGGAIKGAARADLYYGEDAYAAKASKVQNHMGKMYFLILKN